MTPFSSRSFDSLPSILLGAVEPASPSGAAPMERIQHITGEVTNPVHLENFILGNPMARSAIIFGHGRYNAGILIELEDGYEIDTGDAKQVEETRNRLQPVFQRMNMFAPQHSRVQKEMILFAAPTKPFIYTSLSRVNRQNTLAEYSDEINALYRIEARAAHVDLKPPKIWNPVNSLTYVRGIMMAVLARQLDDDADIFNHGTNSLQATRIRIILFHALRSTAKVDTRKYSGNIVYQYRTITGLATFATRTALAHLQYRAGMSLERHLEMREIVGSYSHDFPEHQPSSPLLYDDIILITGTTGLLGSNLLAQFLQNPKVSMVYALNSKKGRLGSTVNRQAALLQASGLDPALARHPKLTFLEADARQCHLGLSQKVYEQLLSSVTHIVHNAWLSVCDDNLPLGVFDGSFRMLRNLVDFALSSPLLFPPPLLFISSTDVVQYASEGIFTSSSGRGGSTGPAHPEDAAGGAYGESKWVGEQILTAAASKTPLQPIIVRIGPLCGAVNGRWREGAIFPMIVRLGVTLGALPRIDEDVRWIPVHIAAQVVAEMRNSLSTYHHIIHPLSISTLTLLRFISGELSLPLIPLPQWTTRLEETVLTSPFPSSHAKPGDPRVALLRHIQHAGDPTATDTPPARIFRCLRIAPDITWFASPTLHGGMKTLGIADVRLWLQHWQEVGKIPRRS